MRTRFYLGPVVRVPVTRKSIVDTGCVTEGCANFHRHMGGKFCNGCGKSYGKYEVYNRAEAVDPYELFNGSEALMSSLSDDKTHRIFRPNIGRKGVPLRYLDDDTNEEVFTADRIVSELRAFRERFHDEIEEVRVAYGQLGADVVWMLCSEVI